MLLHIEKKVLAEIIRAYEAQEQSGKQVFVAFDWMDNIRCGNQEEHDGHCALELSLDGNELFGRT